MRRPPIARTAIAAGLIAVGLLIEFSPTAKVLHPYTTSAVEPGETLTDLEWREVPPGLLPPVEGLELVARVTLAAGTPLTPAVIGRIAAPEGWWALSLELPGPLAPGTSVGLLTESSDTPTAGLILESSTPDEFSYGPPIGIVAVEPDGARDVARSSANGTLLVLMAPG